MPLIDDLESFLSDDITDIRNDITRLEGKLDALISVQDYIIESRKYEETATNMASSKLHDMPIEISQPN